MTPYCHWERVYVIRRRKNNISNALRLTTTARVRTRRNVVTCNDLA